MNAKLIAKFQGVLVDEKQRLLALATGAAARDELKIAQEDLADETDLAATELAQSVLFRLKDRERLLVAKINQALDRIDDGTFGLCLDCEEPIELRRLEARPVSTLCLSCKEKEERREQIYA